MRVVIDTNIIVCATCRDSWPHLTVLALVRSSNCYLMLDHDQILLGEYRRNVGRKLLFQKWYKDLQSKGQISWANGRLPQRIAHALCQRGCHEPEDHVVVALALKGDKYLVTEDSDFGKGEPKRATTHQSVLRYLVVCQASFSL
jgi:predicted nucleic acid-binding protein